MPLRSRNQPDPSRALSADEVDRLRAQDVAASAAALDRALSRLAEAVRAAESAGLTVPPVRLRLPPGVKWEVER